MIQKQTHSDADKIRILKWQPNEMKSKKQTGQALTK